MDSDTKPPITAQEIRNFQKIIRQDYLKNLIPKIEKQLRAVFNDKTSARQFIQFYIDDDTQNFKEEMVVAYQIKRGFTVSFPKEGYQTLCRLEW